MRGSFVVQLRGLTASPAARVLDRLGATPIFSKLAGPTTDLEGDDMSLSVTRRLLVVVLAVLALLASLWVLLASRGNASPSGSSPASSLTLRPNIPTSKPSGQIRSTVGWASRNWSGYAVTPTGNATYSDVTANWHVPRVTGRCSSKSYGCYSAAWTGIDGFNNSSLIQTGTEQDYRNGTATYSAWWTTSAQGFAEQVIAGGCSQGSNTCGTVAPGDAMTAHIAKNSGSTWTITLSDTTKGWTFTKSTTYTGPGTSAEWIMEAPSIPGGHIATLSTYDPFTFDPGTVNGSSPGLVDSDGGELIQKGKVVSIPSPPDTDRDGFAMSHGSIAPPAPSS